MKVVQLITRLVRGGAQRMVLESALHLRRAGHEVEIWCGPETGPEGDLTTEAAERGIPVLHLLDLVRPVHPAHDLAAVTEVARRLSRARPDWLHTHSSKAGIVGREAAARAACCRVAHTVHGWGFTPETPRWLARLFVAAERRALDRTDHIFFVSPGDLAEGVRLGILGTNDPRAETLPPGIDLAPYHDEAPLARGREGVRRALGIDAATPVVGFLGRLAPQKAPHLALEIFRRVGAEDPRTRLLVVGDGPLAAELHARAESEPALRGRVSWAGIVQDPARWYAAMDLLLLPSLWEGTPLTAMEAMAAGLPVVASDLPGIRGLLPAGAELPWARLFPPGDVEAGARGVRAALDRPGCGRDARAHALARFSGTARLERTLAVYREGLAR